MHIKIETPKKKNGIYIAKILNHKNAVYRLKINMGKFISLNKIPASGDLLKIWLNPNNDITAESIKLISEIDNEVLDAIKENNGVWFKNELTEEEIREFFRPSLNLVSHTLSILNATVHQSLLVFNKNLIDSIHDIDFTESLIEAEIEIQGLYFFQKKCGIRWILHKLIVNSNSVDVSEDILDRPSIEETWDTDMESFNTDIDEKCTRLQNKIDKLQKFKKHMNDEYLRSKELEVNKDWNKLLEELSKKMLKYYDGFLE